MDTTKLDRLIAVIRDALRFEPHQVATMTRDTRFAEDLNCDSLDLVKIEVDIEEEFGITLGGNGLLSDIVTIGDAVDLIDQTLQGKGKK